MALRTFVKFASSYKFFNRDVLLLCEMTLYAIIFGIFILGVIQKQHNALQHVSTIQEENMYYAERIAAAVFQYRIDYEEFPGTVSLPQKREDIRPICKQGILSDDDCINIDNIVPEYLGVLPSKKNEKTKMYSGFGIYLEHGIPNVVLCEASYCPLSSS